MSELKQVKVDNWGIFFLQRLKHFFNRTDYCDLTLQFQDNAQLKVHRLVLNACTEYFEILERTCEMYEDCLIMPDDLQTDVMVPIVNFMYTGQLEYKTDMLDKLYQTSQIMNMTVLTKLLDAQRNQVQETNTNVRQPRQTYNRSKRPFTKAFESNTQPSQKKMFVPTQKLTTNSIVSTIPEKVIKTSAMPFSPPVKTSEPFAPAKKKPSTFERRPTRYDLPEELDTDNLFEASFTNISYESKPLMVHPETKHYSAKKPDYGLFSEASTSRRFEDIQTMMQRPSTSSLDLVECKRITTQNTDSIFEEGTSDSYFDSAASVIPSNSYTTKDSNQLFDQILDRDNSPKVTIETKNIKQAGNLDHAKIISEVLKKYPHLVKSNKNIRLKIVNGPTKDLTTTKSFNKKRTTIMLNQIENNVVKDEPERDYTFESDVMDSKEAATLIALGAENIKGPWICLICGTPGRALHFTSYYKFRRHLVEVHNEKPIVNICEHCGLKSGKRNYLLYHMYTKHGIEPPPTYHFPKCSQCHYVALTEALLVRHKLTHSEGRDFRCNVCFVAYKSSHLLLNHIQSTGHKICADRKPNLQCIYCLRVFLRENSLYTHLKTCHKDDARSDGIIDNSDEEETDVPSTSVVHRLLVPKVVPIKYEPGTFQAEDDSNELQYQIQQRSDGDIQVLSKKRSRAVSTPKQKILNENFKIGSSNKVRPARNLNTEFHRNEEIEPEPSVNTTEEMTMIHDNEFVLKQQVLHTNDRVEHDDYIISDIMPPTSSMQVDTQPVSTEFIDNINSQSVNQQSKMILKKPIQIVVSNEEEYKALMASNPSIIFDESNAGKTLTVLTAPHNSSLNAATTIDLNNPQTNDMMIIPEDYSLNVSEAVTASNSNIVVVYSHPVDEQNKQFIVGTHYGQPQLITSESIGAQFVQSSAVITQNYETITTSTPIVSQQVLLQQPVQSWQDNVENNIEISDDQQYNIPVEQESELIQSSTEIVTASTVEDGELTTDLQEEEVKITTQATQVESDLLSEADQEMEDQTVVDNSVIEAPNEDIMQEQESEIIDEPMQEEQITSDIENQQLSNLSNVSTPKENEIVSETHEEIIETDEIDDQSKSMDMVDLATNSVTEISCTNDVDTESANNEDNVIKNDSCPDSVVREKVQILASEWSEDEEESVIDNQTEENVNSPKNTCDEIEENVASNASEAEESVENTSHEAEDNVETTPKNEENEQDASEENNLSTTTAIESKNETICNEELNNIDRKEKISTLLNDWEDNDSRDDALASANDAEPCKEEQDVQGPELEPNGTEMASIVKIKPKHDNVRNLVSDWDDED